MLFDDWYTTELIIQNQDMSQAMFEQIYKVELFNLQTLKVMKLEHCNITFFEPMILHAALKHLSLQHNLIKDLDKITFGQNQDNFKLGDVNLLTIDLSCN